MRARLIANVHQRPTDNLLSHLTALDQVMHVARRRGTGLTESLAMLDEPEVVDDGT